MKNNNKNEKLLEIYFNLAEKHVNNSDYSGGLSFLFTALRLFGDYRIYGKIADIYTELEHYDFSIKYWILYIKNAPKDEVSIAYEKISINYFLLDDLLVCGYYFKKKIDADGGFDDEEFEQKIIDVFNENADNKSCYFVAYPYEKADYSYLRKKAKRALAFGDFDLAYKIFQHIPKQCFNKEMDNEYILISLLNNKSEQVLELCNRCLEKYGENLTTYCQLSSFYFDKKDFFKANFYYQKALEFKKGDEDEPYVLISCAIQQNDNKTANDCLKTILNDRPDDFVMTFYYAISFINLKDYKNGREWLIKAKNIYPDNFYVNFYLKFIKELQNDSNKEDVYLPLYYGNKFENKLYDEFIFNLNNASNQEKFKVNKNISCLLCKDLIDFGLCQDEIEIQKKALLLNSISNAYKNYKFLEDYLISPLIDDYKKIIYIYTLILFGKNKKISVFMKKQFFEVKYKKVLAFDDKNYNKYACAYAYCMAKSAFFCIKNYDKIAEVADEVFSKYRVFLDLDNFEFTEIACVMFAMCNFEGVNKLEDVCRIFNVNYSKIKQVMDYFSGEQND